MSGHQLTATRQTSYESIDSDSETRYKGPKSDPASIDPLSYRQNSFSSAQQSRLAAAPTPPAPTPVPTRPEVPEDTKPELRFTWSEFLSLFNFHSIELENKGSVARDHLANERTFLAWLRTSLSFITIGIGVTQLFRLEHKDAEVGVGSTVSVLNSKTDKISGYGKPLGAIFIVLGIITLLLGLTRFFRVQFMLTKNYFPASRLSLVLLLVVVLAIVLTTFAMVIQTT